jgi:tellurite methyltransferase
LNNEDILSDEHEESLVPSLFLLENIAILPKGRALDIAMGSGRNALFLAANGFEVEGVDISETSVAKALQSAKEEGIVLKALAADLETNYRIKSDYYDLIICFNYLQHSLTSQIKEGLKHGGMVVFETFIIDQTQFGRPNNPDFLLKHNELLDMFRDFRCLRYREGVIENRKAIASLIAEKV